MHISSESKSFGALDAVLPYKLHALQAHFPYCSALKRSLFDMSTNAPAGDLAAGTGTINNRPPFANSTTAEQAAVFTSLLAGGRRGPSATPSPAPPATDVEQWRAALHEFASNG